MSRTLSSSPVLSGLRYCSPSCGRGCTKLEYDNAVQSGQRLVSMLGPRWSYTVWENLGWHFKAQIAGTPFEVSRSADGYMAWIQTSPQFISDVHADPKEAMREALAKMQAIFDEVSGVLEQIPEFRSALPPAAPQPQAPGQQLTSEALLNAAANHATYIEANFSGNVIRQQEAIDIRRAIRAAERLVPVSVTPDGYAYRYPSDMTPGETVLRYNQGEEVNGIRPIETMPFWFAPPPQAPGTVVPESVKALLVAADALDIASDWNVSNVQVNPPPEWKLEACGEDVSDGWCSTSELAKKLREIAALSSPSSMGNGGGNV